MEEGKVFYSDGRVENLLISAEDKEFKPGIYKQNRMFVDACLGNGKVSYPAATLKDMDVFPGPPLDVVTQSVRIPQVSTPTLLFLQQIYFGVFLWR